MLRQMRARSLKTFCANLWRFSCYVCLFGTRRFLDFLKGFKLRKNVKIARPACGSLQSSEGRNVDFCPANVSNVGGGLYAIKPTQPGDLSEQIDISAVGAQGDVESSGNCLRIRVAWQAIRGTAQRGVVGFARFCETLSACGS